MDRDSQLELDRRTYGFSIEKDGQRIDPSLAVPLGDVLPWCEFCEEKLSIGANADGVHACADCAKQLLEANTKYEAEMAEVAGLHVGPNRAQRRAARRAALLRNDGSPKQ